MKKIIDENIKLNQEAVIKENNGPEIAISLYDNIGIKWLFHYGESKSNGLVLIDDTILMNLINKANSSVVAKNSNKKIYDIRISNAVENRRLNLIVESNGKYKLGDDMNVNIVRGINNKLFKDEMAGENYFVLSAHKKNVREVHEKTIELTNNKPLQFIRKNIEQLSADNALILFSSNTMKKAFKENVNTIAKLYTGEETKSIRKLDKSLIESVKFEDKLYKKTYTFLKCEDDGYWILDNIQSNYAGKDKVLYKIDNIDFMTPTLINCVENFYEKE